MAPQAKLQQFIVLPPRGLRMAANTGNPDLRKFLKRFPKADGNFQIAGAAAFAIPEEPQLQMKVLDTVSEDGAKLVEMSPDQISDLRTHQPGLRVVPVRYYSPATVVRPLPEMKPSLAGAAPAPKVTFRILAGNGGNPVAGAKVVAFTDFAQRIGAQGETNKKGEVSLALGEAAGKLDRVYVYPPPGFWGVLRKGFAITGKNEIELKAIDLQYQDALRHFYGSAPDKMGEGIKVAVIDTGVGDHGDLVVEGGLNTVLDEDEKDYKDNGRGHGTHVAGIIAARGTPPEGIRGLAPGVTLRSYRVFGKNAKGASNFAIAKAIDRAVQDGCDLINISISGGTADPAIELAITDARSAGSLVFVAAGNDDRAEVGFPASASLALAVSAMGRKGTFPGGTIHSGDIAAPYGNPDKKNFIASFSNIGDEIDLTGPGVGIISTVPGGYAPDDGTSMACPAVTGMAARLLASRPDLLAMARTSARSDEMAKLVLQSANSLGFGPTFEGRGIL